jgi:alpha-1,2-mannosyltransferase
VWVVPLSACLVVLDRQRLRAAPTWFVVLGWLLVGWVVISPYRILPHSGDLELRWDAFEHGLASVTAGLGLAFLIASVVLAWRTLQRAAPSSSPEYQVSSGSGHRGS